MTIIQAQLKVFEKIGDDHTCEMGTAPNGNPSCHIIRDHDSEIVGGGPTWEAAIKNALELYA